MRRTIVDVGRTGHDLPGRQQVVNCGCRTVHTIAVEEAGLGEEVGIGPAGPGPAEAGHTEVGHAGLVAGADHQKEVEGMNCFGIHTVGLNHGKGNRTTDWSHETGARQAVAGWNLGAGYVGLAGYTDPAGYTGPAGCAGPADPADPAGAADPADPAGFVCPEMVSCTIAIRRWE